MRKLRILLMGTVGMQLTLHAPALPASGQVARAGGYRLVPGEAIAFSALSLLRLNTECILAGKVGNDLHGQRLLRYYRELGTDVRFLKVQDSAKTALSVSLETEDGDRRGFSCPEAARLISADEVEQAFSCKPDGVILKRGLPLSVILAVAEFTKHRGVPVFSDAWDSVTNAPFSDCTHLIPILDEASLLRETHISPDNADRCLAVCEQFKKRLGTRRQVLQLGRKGCFLYDGSNYQMSSPLGGVPTADPRGGDDVFVTAFAVQYLLTGSFGAAADFATAAAALTRATVGGAASIPGPAAIEAFLQKWKL